MISEPASHSMPRSGVSSASSTRTPWGIALPVSRAVAFGRLKQEPTAKRRVTHLLIRQVPPLEPQRDQQYHDKERESGKPEEH